MKANLSSFQPAWWLPGAHAQTIGAYFLRGKTTVPVKRERLELIDGDFVDLDWSDQGSGPIVLLLHGLGGSVESHYARGLLNAIVAQGWRCVVMHFRGCSGEENRLAKSYHAGETTDFHYVLSEIRRREPTAPLVAVGFSLGGNVLLKWLGETANNTLLKVAVAVSVPFELAFCASRLQQGFSRVYQWWLLRKLKQQLKNRTFLLSKHIDVERGLQAKTIAEFDDQVTAPLHGFKNVSDYYQQASSRPYLAKIQTPTLIIHAQDDPFIDQQAIPQQAELAQAVDFLLLPHGGHVGFIAGNLGKPNYWLDNTITSYIFAKLS